MGYVEAIILGFIQGLTEFLPVSSSGHLELAKVILGADSLPSDSLTFTVILHAATALSTVVIFRMEILTILKGLLQFKWNEETQFSLKIIASMIPAALIGFYFEDQLESLFGGQIVLVGFMLIVTSLLLLFADKAQRTDKEVNFGNAFIIGVSQALAMLPGISRSGATISSAVLLGVDRTKAAKFSFLMVVPLIMGKISKDIIGGEISLESSQIGVYAAGFLAAFISGLFACTWMISLVKRSKLSYFALYCAIVGTIAIGYSLM